MTLTGPDGVDFLVDSTTVDSVSEMLQKSTEFVKKGKGVDVASKNQSRYFKV